MLDTEQLRHRVSHGSLLLLKTVVGEIILSSVRRCSSFVVASIFLRAPCRRSAFVVTAALER